MQDIGGLSFERTPRQEDSQSHRTSFDVPRIARPHCVTPIRMQDLEVVKLLEVQKSRQYHDMSGSVGTQQCGCPPAEAGILSLIFSIGVGDVKHHADRERVVESIELDACAAQPSGGAQ